MTNPTGYWCPMCGDLNGIVRPWPWLPGTAWKHAVDCSGPFVFVPVYTPLAVPEETTWGESGGDEAEWWSGFMSPTEARTVIRSLKGTP